MNINFPIGLGTTPFIAISDSGLLARFRLSPNQILQGLVVDISGEKIVLSLDGRLVEARSQIPLFVGEMITLQVRETSENQVLMRLMPQRGNLWRPITDQDLTNLLQSLRLPPDGINQQVVRQLMAQGFELSRENLLDVRESLLPGMAANEANIEATVFLRSLGLPVTEESLALARSQLTETTGRSDQIVNLEKAIQNFLSHAGEGEVADLEVQTFRTLLKDTLGKLIEFRLHPDTPDVLSMSRELNKLLVAVGDSVEGKILRLIDQGYSLSVIENDEHGLLLNLAKTTREHLGQQSTMINDQLVRVQTEAVRLLEGIQFEQLTNAATTVDQGKEGLYVFSLPLLDNGQVRTLRLKITPDAQGKGSSDKAKSIVRVELDLDLTTLGPTTIDLAFDQRKLQCHFANGNSDAVDLIKGASGQLVAALGERGFEVSSVTCGKTVGPTTESSGSANGPVVGTFRVDIQA